MDKMTKGSWLIHHTNKLQGVTNQAGYDKTFLAGKAGILLSAISSNNLATLNNDRLNVLAQAANINTIFELPKLIEILKQQQLVDTTNGGIAVLGVTTAKTLQHTSDIFDALAPNPSEVASITLAEKASLEPVLSSHVTTELADVYKLATPDIQRLMSDAEQIGFIDAEDLGGGQRLLFNGNLFRRETTRKIKTVLDSLSSAEQTKLNELTDKLKKHACVSANDATQLLGVPLFNKVAAIGLFDINIVSNLNEDAGFLTLPSAFSKYSNSMVDDAFDLAKAFISSLTYGMSKSSYARGRIQMVDALLSALVRGESVGPVNAIAQDYKVLELKGVVEVRHGTKKGRSGPMLKLLKTEVGELTLQAIRQGDVSEHSLDSLPTTAVVRFNGPEHNREKVRRAQIKTSPKATHDMLSILRTGGGI
mgnify:FL=1|jgi:hypothetical protein